MDNRLITWMILFPLLGAALMAFAPAGFRRGGLNRWVALACASAGTFCAIWAVLNLEPNAGLQATESYLWIQSYAISYEMGLDGLNVLPCLLVALVFPLLIASQWSSSAGMRGMHGLLLVLQASLFGAACAQDLFLMFFFWALSALPFYFLIAVWGGENRESAAFRAITSATLGNAFLFAALLLIYYSVTPHTFNLQELAGGRLESSTFRFLGQELSTARVAFALIAGGLALRVPIWPLHGWYTRVAEEAPPAILVALSAVSVPVGSYILARLCYSLFPETLAASSHAFVIAGLVTLILAALCATAQRGLRLLLAYVCMAGVGISLIGLGSLNSAGLVGAVYHSFALGLGLAGFGLITGIIADRSGHTRFVSLDDKPLLGGIAERAPVLALVMAITLASLLGFPGFSGFVGHALLLIGSFETHPVAVAIAGTTLLLGTYYFFSMYRLVFLGKAEEASSRFADLTFREKAYLFPLVISLLTFGIYPKPLVELVRPTIQALLLTVK